MQRHPVLLGECHVGEHIVLGGIHAGFELRPAGAQLVGDLAPDLSSGAMIGLDEDLPDRGRWPLGTCASAFAMTCTRQRFQVAPSTRVIAALRPS